MAAGRRAHAGVGRARAGRTLTTARHRPDAVRSSRRVLPAPGPVRWAHGQTTFRREAPRPGQQRVRRAPAVRRAGRLVRREGPPPARPVLLPAVRRGAQPRDDDRALHARPRHDGRGPGRSRRAYDLRAPRGADRPCAAAGEAGHGTDRGALRARAQRVRRPRRAVPPVVPAGAGRGGRLDDHAARDRRTRGRQLVRHRGLRCPRADR